MASVISGTHESALRCARLVDCGRSSTRLVDAAPGTTLLIVAVPDERLEDVAVRAASEGRFDFERLTVFHTSGMKTSDALASLSDRGSVTCSIHPIQTFAADVPVEEQIRLMKGISYGIEGDEAGKRMAGLIVADLEGTPLIIPKEEKISYHLACAVASNYVVSLVGAVEEALVPVQGTVRMRDLEPLIKTSIANALKLGPAQALTGPIARGSAAAVRAHLDALRSKKDLHTLYTTLAQWTLELALRERRITPEQAEQIRNVLAS